MMAIVVYGRSKVMTKALDSQVIKFTSYLSMVGGSLWLPTPIKLFAMI
jgi:hypothetical protein